VAASESIPKISLFFSYSRKDINFCDELESRLNASEVSGSIKIWHDCLTDAGDEWEKKIDKILKTADIILLLVSESFLESPYCVIEMRQALELHKECGSIVIPLIVRQVDWNKEKLWKSKFNELQALPKIAESLESCPDREIGWTDIINGILSRIRDLLADRELKLKEAFLEAVKPDEFIEQCLLVSDMKECAKHLYRMIVRSRFEPDIVIGINGGGMIMAAAVNASLRKPMGVIDVRNAYVTYVSLPHNEQTKARVELQSKNILVADTKLKTGGALKIAQTILEREYGSDAKIRYAVALGYGGWNLSRWEVTRGGTHWPIQFRLGNLPVYVARYTATAPNNHDDNIIEELHPGWEGL